MNRKKQAYLQAYAIHRTFANQEFRTQTWKEWFNLFEQGGYMPQWKAARISLQSRGVQS